MSELITFKQENIKIVNIDEVRESTWNPKKKKGKGYKEVLKSVENRGLVAPIMVRTNPDATTKYEVLDGHQRYNACRDLGYTQILIYDFGELDDETAKSYTIYLETGVKPDKKMFNELLIELKDKIDLPYSIEFIDSLELEEDASPISYNDEEDTVPNYCFTGLSQEDFEYISENIDLIATNEGIMKEKDVLLYLIGEYRKKLLEKE